MFVYIAQETKRNNSILQLTGITGQVTVKSQAVEIIYYDKPSDGSKNGTSDNNIYDKWWFWVIIIGSFILLMIIGIVIYKKFNSIRHSKNSMTDSSDRLIQLE